MTERTTTQSLIRVVLTAAAVLVFGLVVNYFEPGEGWSVFDFVLAQVLVAGAVLVYELGVKRPGTLTSAVLSAGIAAAGGASIIVGMVDDAPGLMLIGMGLIASGILSAFRSVRGGSKTLENRPAA
jgi:peptidoglycan/LPS O-acetylase OafA/YrhL